MERYQDDIARIRDLLREHASGMSITDIAEQVHISRNSVGKYLDILQIQGSVDAYKAGTSKLYFLSSRLPSHAIPEVCTRPFLLIDKEEFVTDTNRQMAELLAIPKERIVGKEFASLPIKVREARGKQTLWGALRGTSIRVQGTIRPENGEPKAASLIFEPIVYENGRPGAALIVEDPQSRAATKDIAGAFSDILALLDDEIEYVVRCTPDGTIRFVNETYCAAAGKTKEDMMNRPFRPLVSAEDAGRIRDHLAQLSVQQPVAWIELRAVMGGGEVRWQRWKDRALFDDRGRLTGYQSCGIDITDLMELKQEIAAAEERVDEMVKKKTEELRSTNRQLYAELSAREKTDHRLMEVQFLLNNGADAVILADRNGHIQIVNERAQDLLGYREEELLDQPLSTVIPSGLSDSFSDLIERLKDSGPMKARLSLATKNGTQIPAEVLFLFLQYLGEDFVGCFTRDAAVKVHDFAMVEDNPR